MPEPNFFFEHPILNSPYERPGRHWELDADGQPTQRIIEQRRRAEFVTPIPKPKTRKDDMGNRQGKIIFNEAYDLVGVINDVREEVSRWSSLPNPGDWGVTPETARLLRHWRQYSFSGIRPFFCQIEAVETAVWLAEVAPKSGKNISDYLARVNEEANPGLLRTALKLATGAGKTAVMAMLIAWQTVNAVRHPQSRWFTKGFLIVTPGITVKDRLRVLLPNDPDSYYRERELVPADMMEDVARAKIVITNYHAFKLRERAISKGGRALLYGRHAGESGASDIDMTSMETEWQMLQRVMPGLVGMGS